MPSDPHREPSEGKLIRRRFARSCAIAHGIEAMGMSANQLMDYVDEHGLPTRVERERMLAAKLAQDDDEPGVGDTQVPPPASDAS